MYPTSSALYSEQHRICKQKIKQNLLANVKEPGSGSAPIREADLAGLPSAGGFETRPYGERSIGEAIG